MRALLLDALGTLVWLRSPAPALRAQLRAQFGIEVTEAQAQRAMAAEIAYYRAHLQEGRDPSGLAALRAACAQVLRGALPPSARLSAVSSSQLTDALVDSLSFEPFPDALPALSAARASGLRLVVVSNWDVSLHEVLERVGLAALLDGVVTSAAEGSRKPDARIFAAGLELAGCEPGAALHVGDSLDEDVAGARAAGIQAVLVRRDGAPGPADVRTIASLAQLNAA